MTPAPPPPPPDRELLLWMYERMGLVREFEERLRVLVQRGVPVGPVHFYTGQEAVAVGVCAALRPSDWIASTHRGHGHCIAKGVEVRAMMAELYGKVTGTNRGKGGSMHITDVRWACSGSIRSSAWGRRMRWVPPSRRASAARTRWRSRFSARARPAWAWSTRP